MRLNSQNSEVEDKIDDKLIENKKSDEKINFVELEMILREKWGSEAGIYLTKALDPI